jgi:hypothetical protein
MFLHCSRLAERKEQAMALPPELQDALDLVVARCGTTDVDVRDDHAIEQQETALRELREKPGYASTRAALRKAQQEKGQHLTGRIQDFASAMVRSVGGPNGMAKNIKQIRRAAMNRQVPDLATALACDKLVLKTLSTAQEQGARDTESMSTDELNRLKMQLMKAQIQSVSISAERKKMLEARLLPQQEDDDESLDPADMLEFGDD